VQQDTQSQSLTDQQDLSTDQQAISVEKPAMPPAKRCREEEQDMVVKLAEGEPLPVDGLLLRMFSGVARGLPADAVEWDVSGLRYNEDKNFSRSAVSTWLNCARYVLHGPDELGDEDTALLRTAEGLHAVLSFAHAVDSPAGLLTAACSQLAQLKVVVQLPEQRVEVALSRQGALWLPGEGDGETFDDGDLPFYVASHQLACESLQDRETLAQPCVSWQQRHELQRAIARQVGACLHVAHLLQLQPLIDMLHRFIFWAAVVPVEGLLDGVLGLVFTDAVFETVVGSSMPSKEAYVESVLTIPGLAADLYEKGPGLLHRHGEMTVRDDKFVCWDAMLVRDFAGLPAHDSVRVELSLERDGTPFVNIKRAYRAESIVKLPARLVLGCHVDEQNWNAVMRGSM
jgi:hypothetical protein